MVQELRESRSDLEARLRSAERAREDAEAEAASLNAQLRDARRTLGPPIRPQRSARRFETSSANGDAVSLRSSAATAPPARRRVGSLTDRSERSETHMVRSATLPWHQQEDNAADRSDTPVTRYTTRATENPSTSPARSMSFPRKMNQGGPKRSPPQLELPPPSSSSRSARERTPSLDSSFANLDLMGETPLMKTQLPKPRFGSRSTLSSDGSLAPGPNSRSSSSSHYSTDAPANNNDKSHKRSFSAGSTASTEFAFAEHLPPASSGSTWLPAGSVGEFSLGLDESDQRFLDDLEGADAEDHTIRA
jgi:hypothetical protein